MVCPKCGNVLPDGSTDCFACGSSLVVPTQEQNNNVSSDNTGISVPQDFKLAGESDNSLPDDLPDAMSKALEDKEPQKVDEVKRKKKKVKKSTIKKIIRTIIIIIILIGGGIFGYNIYYSHTHKDYDLVCEIKNTENGVTIEHQINFTLSDGRHINSFQTYSIKNENMMPLTRTDLDAQLNGLGDVVYDKQGEIVDGKVVITYYLSYYNYSSINVIGNDFITAGYSCKIPEKDNSIKIPFIDK